MQNSRTEFLHYLENILAYYAKYSHHKETMAWAGVVLHIALATQTISSLGNAGSTLVTKLTLTAMLMFISPVTFFYIKEQFKLRRRGSEYESACLALIAEIISQPHIKVNPADYALLTTNDKNLKSTHVLSKVLIKKATKLADQGEGALGRLESLAYWIVILTLILALTRIWIS